MPRVVAATARERRLSRTSTVTYSKLCPDGGGNRGDRAARARYVRRQPPHPRNSVKDRGHVDPIAPARTHTVQADGRIGRIGTGDRDAQTGTRVPICRRHPNGSHIAGLLRLRAERLLGALRHRTRHDADERPHQDHQRYRPDGEPEQPQAPDLPRQRATPRARQHPDFHQDRGISRHTRIITGSFARHRRQYRAHTLEYRSLETPLKGSAPRATLADSGRFRQPADVRAGAVRRSRCCAGVRRWACR